MLEPAIDTGGPMGRMVVTVLGMVAEMELGFIRDRQRAGIEAAKAKGVYKGRPVTFDHERLLSYGSRDLGPLRLPRLSDAGEGTSTGYRRGKGRGPVDQPLDTGDGLAAAPGRWVL